MTTIDPAQLIQVSRRHKASRPHFRLCPWRCAATVASVVFWALIVFAVRSCG